MTAAPGRIAGGNRTTAGSVAPSPSPSSSSSPASSPSSTPDPSLLEAAPDPTARRLGELEQKVYGMLARVPRGKITTYSELARAAGLKNGQRAVGRIMSKNPYPSIIPCHRVVRSTGDVGGYAYGTEVKEEMLSREGVALGGGRISDMDSVMHRFG